MWNLSAFLTVSALTCTVKLSLSQSLVRPFNWTTVLILVYKWQGRIYLLSDCGRQRYAQFSWLLLDLLLVSQTSYKHVSKRLAESTSKSENMDNFIALYTLYLSTFVFTFGTNLMHTSPHAYRILVFLAAVFYKVMLFVFWVQDTAVTIKYAHNA